MSYPLVARSPAPLIAGLRLGRTRWPAAGAGGEVEQMRAADEELTKSRFQSSRVSAEEPIYIWRA